METLEKLIANYRDYFNHRRKMLIDDLSEGEFRAFLLGIEVGALNSNKMKYYSDVCDIIDKYKEELKK